MGPDPESTLAHERGWDRGVLQIQWFAFSIFASHSAAGERSFGSVPRSCTCGTRWSVEHATPWYFIADDYHALTTVKVFVGREIGSQTPWQGLMIFPRRSPLNVYVGALVTYHRRRRPAGRLAGWLTRYAYYSGLA